MRSELVLRAGWAKTLETFVSRNFVFLSVLLIVLAAVLRFVHLGYDSPSWTSPDSLTDEGWWADSARGEVLFGDAFSDDFGTALLVTPAYTGLLEMVYRVFGVGTIQTRALAACASLLTLVAVGWFLLARFGKAAALLGSVLLTLCPLAWAHARVGLVESTQELFIVLAFVLWFAPHRGGVLAFLAGAASALAVWMKPNALLLGTLPLAITAAAELWVAEREGQGRLRAAAWPVLWAAAGFFGCCAAVLWALGPHWDAFVRMLTSETHGESYTIWNYLKAPGLAFMSTETVGEKSVPELWRAAVYAPALFAACWISLLRYRSRPRRNTLEFAAFLWLTATFVALLLEPEQPTRRLMALLPPMAVFGAIVLTARMPEDQTGPVPGFARSALLWLVLTIPVLILIKPFAARALMTAFPSFPMGAHLGFSTAAAGTAVTVAWFALIATLTPFRRVGERIRTAASRWVFAPALLLLLEVPMVVGGTWGATATFLEAQTALGRSVAAGDTVMGHSASSLLMPYAVRTVRRTTPQDHSPPPNPDVWERTRPRYILDWQIYNYGAVPRRYGDVITAHGYTLEQQFALGPYRDRPRFLLDLYRLPNTRPGP